MTYEKKERGITLIVLIITIVVLVILTTVAIRTITNTGIIDISLKASSDSLKAKYFEEIDLSISEEQLNSYLGNNEEEKAFIQELKENLEAKDWVSSIIMCDSELEEQSNAYENSILIITTKEGYEIIVDVDNSKREAKIREESFGKAGEACNVKYDANTGSGAEIAEQSIRKGFSVTLQENTYTKTNYIFVGWCLDKDGNGEKYAKGSKVKIQEDTVFYAIWDLTPVEISFDANEGTGEMESINVKINTDTVLPENTFTRPHYAFQGWCLDKNGSSTIYEEGDTINVSEDTVVYAIWEQNEVTVTFHGNYGDNETYSVVLEKGARISTVENWRAQSRDGYNDWYYKDSNYSERYAAFKVNAGLLTFDEDTDIYINYVLIEYTITYNLLGGTITNEKTTYTIEDDNFTLAEPVGSVNTFIGWTGSNGDTPQRNVVVQKGTTGNLTYTANYDTSGTIAVGQRIYNKGLETTENVYIVRQIEGNTITMTPEHYGESKYLVEPGATLEDAQYVYNNLTNVLDAKCTEIFNDNTNKNSLTIRSIRESEITTSLAPVPNADYPDAYWYPKGFSGLGRYSCWGYVYNSRDEFASYNRWAYDLYNTSGTVYNYYLRTCPVVTFDKSILEGRRRRLDT